MSIPRRGEVLDVTVVAEGSEHHVVDAAVATAGAKLTAFSENLPCIRKWDR